MGQQHMNVYLGSENLESVSNLLLTASTKPGFSPEQAIQYQRALSSEHTEHTEHFVSFFDGSGSSDENIGFVDKLA